MSDSQGYSEKPMSNQDRMRYSAFLVGNLIC